MGHSATLEPRCNPLVTTAQHSTHSTSTRAAPGWPLQTRLVARSGASVLVPSHSPSGSSWAALLACRLPSQTRIELQYIEASDQSSRRSPRNDTCSKFVPRASQVYPLAAHTNREHGGMSVEFARSQHAVPCQPPEILHGSARVRPAVRACELNFDQCHDP
jgi:hypothetical protein